MDLKGEIRSEISKLRMALKMTEVDFNSRLIVNKLLDESLLSMYLNQSIQFKRVMLYSPTNKEVDIMSYVNHLIISGKEVYMPYISDMKNREMKAVQIYNIQRDMTLGRFGINEPINVQERTLNEEHIDLIIVPGVAFDNKLNRLGYGGGFYDRFMLKIRKDCVRIGIAYDFQVLNHIPISNYDIPMDIIITEKRIIHSSVPNK